MTSAGTLADIVRSLPSSLASSRLSTAGEKELALVMARMSDADARTVTGLLPEAKRRRVEELMQRHLHVRNSPDAYELALATLCELVSSGKSDGGLRSHYRPAR